LNRYAYCVGDPVDYFDPDGARHEAGGGASRVSPDAVDLARAGSLDQAKAVQSVYRASVVENYEKGYDYVQVHRLAADAVEQALSLDILAGWLAGISAVSGTVATVAGSVALVAAGATAATAPQRRRVQGR